MMLKKNIVFLTAVDIRRKANVGTGVKMFEYLRSDKKMLPAPIRKSNGRGAIGLYPSSTVGLLKQIRNKQAQGFSLSEVREQLKERIQAVCAEAEYGRNRSQDLTFQKDGSYSAVEFKTSQATEKEADMQRLNYQLFSLFRFWDGKVESLKAIREKIEEIEKKNKPIGKKGSV